MAVTLEYRTQVNGWINESNRFFSPNQKADVDRIMNLSLKDGVTDKDVESMLNLFYQSMKGSDKKTPNRVYLIQHEDSNGVAFYDLYTGKMLLGADLLGYNNVSNVPKYSYIGASNADGMSMFTGRSGLLNKDSFYDALSDGKLMNFSAGKYATRYRN